MTPEPGERGRPRALAQGPTPEQLGRAAALCYEDAERDERIAARLGIARRTLARWKRRPEFAAASHALSEFHRRQLSAASVRRWRLGERGLADPEPDGPGRDNL